MTITAYFFMSFIFLILVSTTQHNNVCQNTAKKITIISEITGLFHKENSFPCYEKTSASGLTGLKAEVLKSPPRLVICLSSE